MRPSSGLGIPDFQEEALLHFVKNRGRQIGRLDYETIVAAAESEPAEQPNAPDVYRDVRGVTHQHCRALNGTDQSNAIGNVDVLRALTSGD